MPQKVLIIEDDDADLALIRKNVLDFWPDAIISHSASMSETYETLKTNNFHLILLDLNLEDSFGASSVEELRRFDRRSSVVVLTSMLTDQIVSNCLKFGANHVTPKEYIGSTMLTEILEQHVKM
ncbi:MAG: response regulator [Alphaproteobacteria bacterium]